MKRNSILPLAAAVIAILLAIMAGLTWLIQGVFWLLFGGITYATAFVIVCGIIALALVVADRLDKEES